MVKSVFLILFLVGLFSSFILPQGKNISQKKDELSQLQSQIDSLENQIKLKNKKEKATYEDLENYSKQRYLLNKLINKLKVEEKKKQEEINSNASQVDSLKSEISILKQNYSKYLVAIYKYGEVSELAALFDAASVEQAILRYKYLQKFSDRRKEDLVELADNIKELNDAKARLEKEREDKKMLTRRKTQEEKGLTTKVKERRRILNIVKNDKVSLKKELNAKKNAEIKIKQLIDKLIADANANNKENDVVTENKPVETNVTPKKDYNLNLSTNKFSSFADLKGSLNWPIQDGKIISKYGEHLNDNLNTVTLNYGIDIKATDDLDVKCVAEGVVSVIDWIPGYGSVVIVTHKGDYRTVYSHLGELYVNEGDVLKTGSVIGKVSESLQGYILHFEIWNSRQNQDPETWLAHR
jgi:murein hydrolase activator